MECWSRCKVPVAVHCTDKYVNVNIDLIILNIKEYLNST